METYKSISECFYGKKIFSLPKLAPSVAKRMHIYQASPVPLVSNRSKLIEETQIWKTFYRQADAIKYASEIGMELMVFAFEVEEGGKRMFLVCHPKCLWNIIKERPLHFRCTYEVIPEDCTSKLYFDLEYDKKLNPTAEGFSMVKIFIAIVNYFLKQEFDIDVLSKEIIILDSTTSNKFSSHLIYNSSFAFCNNKNIGVFVAFVCDQIYLMVKTNESRIHDINIGQMNDLFVINRPSSRLTALFCDQGVYTKNRNFRTYHSTKYKKQTPFVLSSLNQYKPIPDKKPVEENYFLGSLVTFRCEGKIVLEFNTTNKVSRHSPQLKPDCKLDQVGDVQSPIPAVDDFIKSLLGENSIRSWRFYSQNKLLVYDISKIHRFCYNVGREHKSNGVIYLVNLERGVYYQKCHDHDCRNFKSNEMPLPPHTITCINKWSERQSEEELLEAIAQIEKQEGMNKYATKDLSDFDEVTEQNVKKCKLEYTSGYISDDEMLQFSKDHPNVL